MAESTLVLQLADLLSAMSATAVTSLTDLKLDLAKILDCGLELILSADVSKPQCSHNSVVIFIYVCTAQLHGWH